MNKKEIMKSVGFLCSFFRKKKGITQKEVANYLGITQTRISEFENGRNDSLFIFLAYIDLNIIVDTVHIYGQKEYL